MNPDEDIPDDRVSETQEKMDDVSRDQLDKIKARTMYNMVEPLDSGNKKLLFLTNAQALLLASEPQSMEKMLLQLDINEPQLVINLLHSPGFGSWMQSYKNEAPFDADGLGWCAGINTKQKPAFNEPAEERKAETQIDTFMRDVLLPLAAETRAVVVTSAVPAMCQLSASFLRMFTAKRSTWAAKCPFTILSVFDAKILYANDQKEAYWMEVRALSRAWKLRDARIKATYEKVHPHDDKDKCLKCSFDLDRNANILIVVDPTEEKKECFDLSVTDHFVNELVRYLSLKLPSLAVKTAFSGKFTLGEGADASALTCATASAQAGTPTLLLDIRRRPKLKQTNNRQELINEAKALYTKDCEKYVANGIQENMDVCSLAYFHDVLVGDGNATSSSAGEGVYVAKTELPLWQAIKMAKSYTEEKENDKLMKKATSKQTTEVAEFLVDRYFKDAYGLLTPEQKLKIPKDIRDKIFGPSIESGQAEELRARKGQDIPDPHEILYKERMFALATNMTLLLSSENIYHLNLEDIEGGARLVNKLVRLDRLPKTNPLEGLELLRSAWQDYDVAMMFAGRYKCWCKFLFVLQLLLGWAVVGVAAIAAFLETNEATKLFGWTIDESDTVALQLKYALFGVSLTMTLLLSLGAVSSSKHKWRHLRHGACVLQSAIWCYRARVGMFEMDETRRRGAGAAELALVHVLRQNRDHLMAEAKLGSSNYHKVHPPSVYKHYQDEGEPKLDKNGKYGDDMQSPIQPHRYIELRIKPTMAFFAARIPTTNKWKTILKVIVVLLSVAASTLARYQFVSLVVMATSASSAITSWSEFADLESKSERYTRAISGLRNLLDWWKSLTEVQKASRESIGHLVLTSEGIIGEEQTGWTSVAKKSGDDTQTMNIVAASAGSREGSTKVHPTM